jgi:hypothetical protein
MYEKLEDNREIRILQLRADGWGYGTIANIVNEEFPQLRELNSRQVRYIIERNEKGMKPS